MEVARGMRFRRPNVDSVSRRLEERAEASDLELAEDRAARGGEDEVAAGAEAKVGIGIVTLRLEGEKFIARVFPPLQSRPQSDTDERDGAMSEDDQKQMRKICREDEAVRDFGCAKNVDWNKPR